MADRRPYVEITFNPNLKRRFKTATPEFELDSDSQDGALEPPGPQLHKKQKIQSSPTQTDIESENLFPPSSFVADDSELSHSQQDPAGCSPADGPPHYHPRKNEILETDGLYIPGETRADNDSDQVDAIPVRTLSDFSVYDRHTKALVSLSALLEIDISGRDYTASGLVGSWTDPEDSDSPSLSGDESDSESADSSLLCVTLDIFDFNVHFITDSKDIDSKIYVETQHAWYILVNPSRAYAPFFSPFWIRSRITNLCIAYCVDNPRTTFPLFMSNLSKLDLEETSVCSALDILGRELSEDDFSESVKAYLVHMLNTLSASLDILRVPLVRELVGSHTYAFEPTIKPRADSKAASQLHLDKHPQPELLPVRNKKKSKPSKAKTFLTPIVNRIAERLFEGSLEVAESLHDATFSQKQTLVSHQEHPFNPKSVVWGPELKRGIYSSATIDGTLYSIGDYVMIQPSTDWPQRQSQASQTINFYGNQYWFCQIRYFFNGLEEDGTPCKMFHGIWLTHGSKTILQETSHTQALYFLNLCDNNAVASIFQKCNVAILCPGDAEPVDAQEKMANNFHCSLLYDEDTAAFTNIPPAALNWNSGFATDCFCCTTKDHEDNAEEIQYLQDSVVIWGITYHCYDFVYICPSSTTDKSLLIAQITDIQESAISVQYLGHFHDFVLLQSDLKHQLVADERRLFFTEDCGIIHPSTIDGKCYVQHLVDPHVIDSWIIPDNHYYLKQKGSTSMLFPMDPHDFKFCMACHKLELQANEDSQEFLLQNTRLTGMELFSGAGGLGLGMDLSAFVETKYAVEYFPSAAKTYKKNHPHSTVYCQDSSALLKHAIQPPKNSNSPLLSLDTTTLTYLPPLLRPEEKIDFIFGGPPCQSFSIANHSKRPDDIRSTIPCNMLSYAEYYNPSYFLLENVHGFLMHKFYSSRASKSGLVETVIEFGMVKLVMRSLIALGYQVHFRLLQAAQYGAPQSRRRVIFWAAKRGIALPAFPAPVYAYPKGCHKVTLPASKELMPVSRSRNPKDLHQYAPLRPVTVDMAISDLKKFDWKNPHVYIPAQPQDKAVEQARLTELSIPAFDATASAEKWKDFYALPGFPEGAEYDSEPQNSFQKWMRLAMLEEDQVTGHYTSLFSDKIVEATTMVPLAPNTSHHDLPLILLPDFAQKESFKKTLYGRIGAHDFFKCQVTTMSPVLKNQFPLHPTQKRLYSVREVARCQGFPDEYVFESTSTEPKTIIRDQLRQIGNAVAVPFALALGKELGKALVADWKQTKRQGSEPL